MANDCAKEAWTGMTILQNRSRCVVCGERVEAHRTPNAPVRHQWPWRLIFQARNPVANHETVKCLCEQSWQKQYHTYTACNEQGTHQLNP